MSLSATNYNSRMKTIGAFILGLLLCTIGANAGTIVLEGKYQQKNIYVINSIAAEGVGFCVYEVLVNGEISSDEWNSNAFEVDLSVHGLKLGDDVVVTIKYKEDCEPRVLNPGALEPQPTFDASAIEISSSGLLKWTTINEQGKLPFIIQHFKWNKWVNVGEVMGVGTSVKNEYTFQTNPVSGVNKFRVIQRSHDGNLRKSDTVEFESPKPVVSFEYVKKEQKLVFSHETNYELYNVYGQIIKRGFGNEADVSNLAKSEYYISFDAFTQKFLKK